MYDRVIRGGLVIDGTGRAGYVADVAIADGRLAAIGRCADHDCDEIEAVGLVVAPGFIDDQGGHAELAQTAPEALLAELPGVTTLLLNAWDATTLQPPAQRPAPPEPPAAGPQGAPGHWPINLAWRREPPVQWVHGPPLPATVAAVAQVAQEIDAPIVWRPETSAPPPSWPALWEALEHANAEAMRVYWHMTDWPAADHADTLVELLQRPYILLGGFPPDPRDAAGPFVRSRLAPCRRWPGRVPLERLVHKLAAWPAHVYGLRERGRLAVGCVADLVLFNADTGELAYTLVAGEPVVAEGLPTGARPGAPLLAGAR
ncbi:MAG TPA: amidohydrolase family protein [Chloroflexota bacterium]|nr:amidohydrolase family protein [Chloroflexota bacterium]